ncbi:MAG: Gfo/Idh/MocA family oxidoreductase [Acidobacteriota bacterium]
MAHISRRSLLAGSALVAASSQAQTSSIGVGMIGVGNRGGHLLKQVLEVPGTSVRAICDLKPDRVDRAASMAAKDKPAVVRDWKQLLERKDVDAVHIATPCDLHPEMAIAALKAGKHVYLEKPAGIEPKSIAELVKVAKASNKVLIIGQQMRSSKRNQAIIASLRDGLVGEILMVKAQRHSGDDLAHDSSSADWFFDAKRSGDVLVEMSVHNLDVCNWIINEYPERAAGFGGTQLWKNDPPGRTNMDGYTLSYDYPGGVKLSYTQVFFHWSGLPGGGQVWNVYGSKGALDFQSAMFYPRTKGESPKKVYESDERENIDLDHVKAFYEAIRTGKPVPTGIKEGASGALTAIMGREAIYQKRVTTWKEMGVTL